MSASSTDRSRSQCGPMSRSWHSAISAATPAPVTSAAAGSAVSRCPATRHRRTPGAGSPAPPRPMSRRPEPAPHRDRAMATMTQAPPRAAASRRGWAATTGAVVGQRVSSTGDGALGPRRRCRGDHQGPAAGLGRDRGDLPALDGAPAGRRHRRPPRPGHAMWRAQAVQAAVVASVAILIVFRLATSRSSARPGCCSAAPRSSSATSPRRCSPPWSRPNVHARRPPVPARRSSRPAGPRLRNQP